MAVKKVTDLPALTTASPDDVLYIIDASDTTESPEGTSKQIEFSYLQSGLSGVSSLNLLTGHVDITSQSNVRVSTSGANIVLQPVTLVYKGTWRNTTPAYFNLVNNTWNRIPFNVFEGTWDDTLPLGLQASGHRPTWDNVNNWFTINYDGFYRIHFKYYTYDTNNINIQSRCLLNNSITRGIFFDSATHNAGADSLRMYEGTLVTNLFDGNTIAFDVFPDANQPYPAELNNQAPQCFIEYLGPQAP